MAALATVPRHDFAAEQAVLGACLLAQEFAARDPAYQDVVPRTLARLTTTDFFPEHHRRIFGAVRALAEQDRAIAPDLVRLHLDALGLFGDVERDGLMACVENATTPALLDGYLETIVGFARPREAEARLRHALTRLQRGEPLAEIGRALSDELAGLTDASPASPRRRAPQPLGAVVREVLTSLDAPETDFVPTPVPELTDRLGGGLLRGELVYLKGPAAAAKTAFAIQWAALAAWSGLPTLVVTREMAATALCRRLIAQQLRVPAGALRRRAVGPEGRARVEAALTRIDAVPLWFDDATETIGGILRAATRGGYRFVVVDYVQLVTSPADSKDERRELEAVSKGLKRLAMRGCSVLALSAVTRLPQDPRAKKERPSYQLRGSERLQHDADVVLTIYRPRDESPDRTLVYDKLREGESGGDTTLEFSSTYLTFDQADAVTPAWVTGKDD